MYSLYICLYVHHKYAVPIGARRGHWLPLKIADGCELLCRNQTQVHCKSRPYVNYVNGCAIAPALIEMYLIWYGV